MRHRKRGELTPEMRATPRDQWPEDWIFRMLIELAPEFDIDRTTVLDPRTVRYAMTWIVPGIGGPIVNRLRERVIRYFLPG